MEKTWKTTTNTSARAVPDPRKEWAIYPSSNNAPKALKQNSWAKKNRAVVTACLILWMHFKMLVQVRLRWGRQATMHNISLGVLFISLDPGPMRRCRILIWWLLRGRLWLRSIGVSWRTLLRLRPNTLTLISFLARVEGLRKSKPFQRAIKGRPFLIIKNLNFIGSLQKWLVMNFRFWCFRSQKRTRWQAR